MAEGTSSSFTSAVGLLRRVAVNFNQCHNPRETGDLIGSIANSSNIKDQMRRLLFVSSITSLLAVVLMNVYESVRGFESIFGLFRSPSEIITQGFGEFLVFWFLALVVGSSVSFFRRKSKKRNRGIASSVFATFLFVVVALTGVHHPHLPLEHVALRGTLTESRF